MRNGGFRCPVRVYYEDTDAAGIVYYANYLKFMERARTEWLRSLGYEQRSLARDHDVLFTVARMHVRYRSPTQLDDRLEVTVRVGRIGHASFDMQQEVLRERAVLACEAQVRIACVRGADMRPRRIPNSLLVELRREH